MSSAARLMGAGMPAAQAIQLGVESNVGGLITATGSTQAGGVTLSANFNLFGTVASGTGAVLPFAESQGPYFVYNGGSNALLVYPQATEIINAGSVGVGFSVGAGKSCTLFPGKNTAVSPAIGAWIANLSA